MVIRLTKGSELLLIRQKVIYESFRSLDTFSKNVSANSMLNVLRRKTCRLVRLGIRLQSTEVEPPKQLGQILREMSSRKPRTEVKRYATGPLLYTNMMNDDLFSPIQLGDIVLVGLNPVVVVGVPSASGEPLVVADAGGSAREVPIPAIEARMGRFFQVKKLGDVPMFADPTTRRSLSREMYARVSEPLRRFYTHATKLSSKLLDRVQEQLLYLQEYDRPCTIPYIDFVAKVCQHDRGSEIPIRDFYAVRLAMEHYKCSNKYLLEFHYFSRYTLTVLPFQAECRNINVVMASNPSTNESEVQRFIREYAVGNMRGLGNCEVEGCAIELLRRLPRFSHLTIDESVAAELALIDWGEKPPSLEAYVYEWFTKNGSPDSEMGSSLEIGSDRLSALRRDFEDPVYCIDDADAKEIDDGISFHEIDSEVAQLGIHIADPTSFFDHLSVLPILRKRPTAVYIGNQVARMWPEAIAQSCGLIEGKSPPAISVMCEINWRTGEMGVMRIAAHRLKNVKQMSPDQVKPLLDDPQSVFHKLAVLANALARSRQENGAFNLRIGEEPPLNTLSCKRLVAEIMILANRLMGSYCYDHRIPTVYRCQALQFWSTEERERFHADVKEKGGVAYFCWREALQRSIPSILPAPHAALGVSSYTRFTSPLRRLEDTLLHFQLGFHLLNTKLPFKRREVYAELPWITCAQATARDGERIMKRFETLRRIETGQDKINSIPGIFAVTGDDSVPAQIYLPDLDLMASFVGNGESVEVDSHALFEIVGVSSAGDRIDVKLCT